MSKDNFNFSILKGFTGTQISETPNGVVRLGSDGKLREKATDGEFYYQSYDPKPIRRGS